MRLVEVDTARDYLVESGVVARDELVAIRWLSGGVSNVVLLVEFPGSARAAVVLKQARGQLRVPQPWFCSVERLLREIDVLRICQSVVEELPEDEERDAASVRIHTPKILYEDRPNFALVMTAAPFPHATWKERLLAGERDACFAIASGRLLGWLHAQTWNSPIVARDCDERVYFDDLRVDPYYRQVARVHADLRPRIDELIDSVMGHRRALVHGDFSPKNLLVWGRNLMLIDFEVGHFGDPAFDLGFFLTHLALKSFHFGLATDAGREMRELTRCFWRAYAQMLESRIGDCEWRALQARAVLNFGGCLLARVDGKSRVDYLRDPNPVREFARQTLRDPPLDWEQLLLRFGAGEP